MAVAGVAAAAAAAVAVDVGDVEVYDGDVIS